MGFAVVYCPEDDDANLELGDEFASLSGYGALRDWIDRLGADYDALQGLAEDGCAVLEALEKDLCRALREKPGQPGAYVLGVARALLAAVRDAPPGTAAVGLTDGEA